MFFYMAMTFALGNGIPQKDSLMMPEIYIQFLKVSELKSIYDQLSMSTINYYPVENIEIDNYLEDDISVNGSRQ